MGFAKGQRTKKKGFDDAVHGGICANADSERDDRYCGEAPIRAELPRAVAEILRQIAQPV